MLVPQATVNSEEEAWHAVYIDNGICSNFEDFYAANLKTLLQRTDRSLGCADSQREAEKDHMQSEKLTPVQKRVTAVRFNAAFLPGFRYRAIEIGPDVHETEPAAAAEALD